jgi:hypothetical protein
VPTLASSTAIGRTVELWVSGSMSAVAPRGIFICLNYSVSQGVKLKVDVMTLVTKNHHSNKSPLFQMLL